MDLSFDSDWYLRIKANGTAFAIVASPLAFRYKARVQERRTLWGRLKTKWVNKK